MTAVSYRPLPFGSQKITYELSRRAVKNINLRIRQDGTILVSAPPFVSQRQIDEFLCREQSFIRQTLDKIKKAPVLQLRTGETLCLNGRPYPLIVTEAPAERMYRKEHTLYMETRFKNDAGRRSYFAERVSLYQYFLAQEAVPLFRASLSRIYPLVQPYGVPLPSCTVRCMKTRWGSCTPARQAIRLNSYLAVMPDRCIDQVVLHELCHFLECNHSARFYSWMSRFMPEWKIWREEIKQYISYCL